MATPGTGSDKLASLNARLAGGITGDAIDPASLGGTDADAGTGARSDAGTGDSGSGSGGSFAGIDPGTKRKRGRPPGSGKGTKQKASGVDASGLETLLFSIHLGLAGVLKNPEWALDRDEAKQLASATKAVTDYYNFEATQEAVIWTNLIVALAVVYGPRVISTVGGFGKKKEPLKTVAQNDPLSSGMPTPAAPVPEQASNSPTPTMPSDFDASLYSHLGHG